MHVDDSDSPFSIGYDTLVSLVYKVKSPYRARGTWVMNSATAAVVMKLKDSQQRPLWVDGLAAGQPNRLLGYPVEIWEQMPDIDVSGGSNDSYAIGFGDFRRAYRLLDRHDVRITLDQLTGASATAMSLKGGRRIRN